MALHSAPIERSTYENLSIIIPAFNESEGIGTVLNSLIAELPGSEIIVVDDGSIDGTSAEVAGFPGVTLLAHEFNRGYGAAIKSGMRAATRDFIAWFDADNEHKADLLTAMLCRLERKRLAAVLGQRDRSSTPVRGVGKMVIWLLARLLSVKSGSDLNCGLRIFRREIIAPYISVLPNGYSASMTSTIILIENKLPFEFHPVTVNPRMGQSKVALVDGFRTALLVFRIVTLFAPMRLFLPIGCGTIALGFAYSLWVAMREGVGFPVLGAIVMVTGLLIAMMGLIADQISQIRLMEIDRSHN